MHELLLRIQDACLELNGVTLAIPGLIAVVLGLFLWLGGIRYSAIVLGVLGAGLGAFIGLFISQWFDFSTTACVFITAVIFTIIAVLLQNVLIVLLATFIFAIACGSVYLGQTFDNLSSEPALTAPQAIDSGGARLDYLRQLARTDGAFLNLPQEERHNWAVEKLKNAWQSIKNAASQNRLSLLMWVVLGAIVGLILGFVLKKIMLSFCCATVGTSAVIIGFLALLLAKGTPVMDTIFSRPKILPAVFIAMILFGWLIQLLMLGAKKTKKPQSSETQKKE